MNERVREERGGRGGPGSIESEPFGFGIDFGPALNRFGGNVGE